MAIKKSEIGKLGEDIACEYLVNKKYRICERNFRKPWGELDIIAKDKDGVLVFVEVKTMRQCGNAAIQPEENLTAAKLKKLKRTASLYAGYNSELINDKKGWRIDLIAIIIYDNFNYNINHYENI
jgi:putative endonuclease